MFVCFTSLFVEHRFYECCHPCLQCFDIFFYVGERQKEAERGTQWTPRPGSRLNLPCI